MSILLTLMLASASPSPVCKPLASEQQPVIADEQAAVSAAQQAWRKNRYSELTIQIRKPYRATLANGVWHVVGTVPQGKRGGSPEAMICASDGLVIKVFHTQ